jgi:hypothetical protein
MIRRRFVDPDKTHGLAGQADFPATTTAPI